MSISKILYILPNASHNCQKQLPAAMLIKFMSYLRNK